VPEFAVTADLDLWIAYERDAAWTAKLAILRARRREDIAHFGGCLREHDRHATELEMLARLVDPAREATSDPTFVTRDAFVVGAIDDARALLDAMERLEGDRIARYELRRRPAAAAPAALLDGVLDRHLSDARTRLASLRRLRAGHAEAAA
jgi:hypothetical protein